MVTEHGLDEWDMGTEYGFDAATDELDEGNMDSGGCLGIDPLF